MIPNNHYEDLINCNFESREWLRRIRENLAWPLLTIEHILSTRNLMKQKLINVSSKCWQSFSKSMHLSYVNLTWPLLTIELILSTKNLMKCKMINVSSKHWHSFSKPMCLSYVNSGWTLLTKLNNIVIAIEIWHELCLQSWRMEWHKFGKTENESMLRKNFVALFQILVNNMKPMHFSYVRKFKHHCHLSYLAMFQIFGHLPIQERVIQII